MNKKVCLSIGYHELILDADVAYTLFDTINSGEIYMLDSDYVKDENGNQVVVKKLKSFNDRVLMKGVSHEEYAMWKLAGVSK